MLSKVPDQAAIQWGQKPLLCHGFKMKNNSTLVAEVSCELENLYNKEDACKKNTPGSPPVWELVNASLRLVEKIPETSLHNVFKKGSLGSGQSGVLEASLTASFVSHLPKTMVFSQSEREIMRFTRNTIICAFTSKANFKVIPIAMHLSLTPI